MAKCNRNNKDVNVFLLAQYRAEVLKDLYDIVVSKLGDVMQYYKAIGKSTKQAKSWGTGELLWEDDEHTIPKYEAEYGYVTLSEDELDEGRLAKRAALLALQDELRGLL